MKVAIAFAVGATESGERAETREQKRTASVFHRQIILPDDLLRDGEEPLAGDHS